MVCHKQLFDLLMMSQLEWIHYCQCRSAAEHGNTDNRQSDATQYTYLIFCREKD